MSEPRYVLVAIPLGFRTAERGTNGLTYEIPHELSAVVSVGMRVVVPLGTRRVTGVVVECPTQKPSSISHVRPIEDVLDRRPVFDSAFLKWTKWIAQYYLTSWGEVLETALPQGLRTESKNVVKVSVSDVAQEIKRLKASSKRRAEVLERVASYPDG